MRPILSVPPIGPKFLPFTPLIHATTAVFDWFFSVTDKSARAEKERKAFDAQYVRSMTGVGATGASDH